METREMAPWGWSRKDLAHAREAQQDNERWYMAYEAMMADVTPIPSQASHQIMIDGGIALARAKRDLRYGKVSA